MPFFPVNKAERFEEQMRPHLDSAYNLTRYLVQNAADAEDILQEALIRAFRFFDAGRDLRPWFLQIVRNCAYTWLKARRQHFEISDAELNAVADPQPTAEILALQQANAEEIRAVLQQLNPEFQEVLILREMEQLSYRDIAQITGLPEGTVMSRLARARGKFRELYGAAGKGVNDEYRN